MFVIVNNGSVILGPMRWNRFRFENCLAEELEIAFELPTSNDVAIVVDDVTKILPVQSTEDPGYNPKIELLHGPMWQFTDDVAISSFERQPLPIEAVKNQLKAQVASARWALENSTLAIAIKGSTYTFQVNRDTRSLLQSAVSTKLPQIDWKVNGDTWITLLREDIQEALDYIILYVQAGFSWELAKAAQIDACTTLEVLNAIVLDDVPSVAQPTSIGKVVSMRQARLALFAFGKLADVDAAIDALSEPTRTAAKIEWEFSSEVYRNRPLVMTLGPALGLSAEQLDAMFDYAATL